jgi:NADH-quinone oxidoreductase subunit K
MNGVFAASTGETALLENYLLLGALLFAIGLIGFLARRNMIVMFLCVEMMLQGVSLSLIAWGRYHNDWDGQMLVIFVIAVAACEAGIALVLFLMLCKRSGNLDIVNWQSVREEGHPGYVDREIPEQSEEKETWPSLTPAGVQPELDPEQQMHRTHV